VAGGWMDTAGEQTYCVSAAATDIPTMVHGYNLDGDLDIVNMRRLNIPRRFGGWICLLQVEVERETLVYNITPFDAYFAYVPVL
jgi:hypothetical protein